MYSLIYVIICIIIHLILAPGRDSLLSFKRKLVPTLIDENHCSGACRFADTVNCVGFGFMGCFAVFPCFYLEYTSKYSVLLDIDLITDV